MSFKCTYGGRIRPSYATPTTYGVGETWEIGEVLTLSGAVLVAADNNTKGEIGIAQEYRRSATDDQTLAGVNTGKGSVIEDTAVIETTVVASGVTFTENSRLYLNAGGDICQTASGANRPLGTVKSWSASTGLLTALWSPMIVV